MSQNDLYLAPNKSTYQILPLEDKIQHMVAFLHNVELKEVNVDIGFHRSSELYIVMITSSHNNCPIFEGRLFATVVQEFTEYFGQFLIEHFKCNLV